MNKLLYVALVVSLLTACREDENEGYIPYDFEYFFQVVDQDGKDPFMDWSDEQLSQIRFKGIDVWDDGTGEYGETSWKHFQIWRTDTAVIFQAYEFHDTTFIHFPAINRMDTITHQRVCIEKPNTSLCDWKKSDYYYNSEWMAELDFESEPGLLRHLFYTNQDSLTTETYVMRFRW